MLGMVSRKRLLDTIIVARMGRIVNISHHIRKMFCRHERIVTGQCSDLHRSRHRKIAIS